MIKNSKKFQISDLPDSMLKEVRRSIRFYSVAMLIYKGEDSKAIPASGTLCRIGQQCGIVTARHVWAEIEKHLELKIVIGQGAHTFKVSYLASFGPSILGNKFGCSVPDIIFIKLPSNFCSTFEANRKLFYPLNKSLSKHGNNLYSDEGYWCTFGSPEKRLKRESGQVPSVIYGTSIPQKCEENRWDYLELDVIAEEGEMPQDVRGMSGGGIWRTLFSPIDFSIYDIIFSGVNFYQTEIGKKYQIIGHGPKSIYKNLLELVNTQ